MNFFKIFNVIYKLFTERGRKTLVITFIIIVLFLVFSNNVFALTPGYSDEFDLSYDDFNYLNYGYFPNSQGGYVPGSLRSLYVPYITLNDDNTITFNSSNNSLVYAVPLNDNYAYLLKKEQVKVQRIALINSFSELPDSENTTKNIPVTNLLLNYDFYFLGSNNFLLIQVSNDADFNKLTLGVSKQPVSVLFGGSSSGGGSGGGSSADYSEVLNQIYTDIHTIAGVVQNTSNNDVVNAVTDTSTQTQNVINTTSQQTQNLITNQTQQSQQQYNDFTNSTMTDSDIELPTDNNQDITSNGFDSIFTSMYNVFTTDNAPDIVLPIPYANENITISPNAISSMIGNNVIVSFIQAWYWFIVSYYIYKDVQKVIEKIKDGSIATSSDTNIKTEML